MGTLISHEDLTRLGSLPNQNLDLNLLSSNTRDLWLLWSWRDTFFGISRDRRAVWLPPVREFLPDGSPILRSMESTHIERLCVFSFVLLLSLSFPLSPLCLCLTWTLTFLSWSLPYSFFSSVRRVIVQSSLWSKLDINEKNGVETSTKCLVVTVNLFLETFSFVLDPYIYRSRDTNECRKRFLTSSVFTVEGLFVWCSSLIYQNRHICKRVVFFVNQHLGTLVSQVLHFWVP